jgi:hypothetical protein
MSPRELDALRKRYVAEQKQADSASKWQLANDIVSGINDIVGRGVIAPILGMPGDINQAIYDAGAFVNNKIKDVEVATGMVKQPRYVQPSKGNAYLGSEDIGNRMQQAGLVSSERRPMTELAASLISPSAAAKSVLNAPKTAMNALRMVENLEAPSRGVRTADGMYIPRSQMGAIENLWHGSPHTFDRFDLSKIGTGEGAQAYGYGAYLAESPDVAQEYYKKFSLKPDAENAIIQYGSADKAREATSAKLAVQGLPEVERRQYERVLSQLDSGSDASLYQARLAWPDAAREASDPLSPENFLDWDKPLSEQSPKTQEILKGLDEYDWLQVVDRAYNDDTGRYIYDAARLDFGDDLKKASQELYKAGIPGIRYLDAGSRGSGKGTSNYVVFDDKLIDIVSRNNQPIKK